MNNSQLGFGNYDLHPSIAVPNTGSVQRSWSGAGVYDELRRAGQAAGDRPLVIIDTYPGVDLPDLMETVKRAWPEAEIVDAETAAKPIEELDQLLERFITDDRLFGYVAYVGLNEFYDSDKLAELSAQVADRQGPTVLMGWGAHLVDAEADVLVLADMPRWEIQTRQRNGATNWHCNNADEDQLRKYKRSFFVEWRTADLHKRAMYDQIDYLLDTVKGAAEATMITAEAMSEGLAHAVTRPFRVQPYFDPGSWGGQWMREVCGLDKEPKNFAWCFDCVPEENSLVLDVDGVRCEMPASNLTYTQPKGLLGARTFARFGAEFPIRFDLLDTMEGGNLSLQVHPLTQYIQQTFGMNYTQDESYYLLDAEDDALVYLGVKPGTSPELMIEKLREAERGEISFPAEEFVNTYPARKHDHFPIPSGTLHCSGANSMVLEISATPFIFTFKVWDWDRLGLDGKPRPINVGHAEKNIQWDRDDAWVEANLLNQTRQIAEGEGWVEEFTGLHETEFIETRRHWITGVSEHDTEGTVHVMNLVEGGEAIIESPTGAFEPFVVHYAETFIIPAAAGRYTVRPHGISEGTKIGTITAYVRGTKRSESTVVIDA